MEIVYTHTEDLARKAILESPPYFLHSAAHDHRDAGRVLGLEG